MATSIYHRSSRSSGRRSRKDVECQPFSSSLRHRRISTRLGTDPAGVQEALVYKKFVSNDNWLVTQRQSRMIADRLTAWLQGRNLTLDLAEANGRARASTDGLRLVLRAVGNQKEGARLERNRRAKRLPFRVDRGARKAIREFAAFCADSGGFYVS